MAPEPAAGSLTDLVQTPAQREILTRLTAEKLKKRGFCVLLHSQIPPNDGGIALGQAAAAAFRIHKQNQ